MGSVLWYGFKNGEKKEAAREGDPNRLWRVPSKPCFDGNPVARLGSEARFDVLI
jgi:hypothetical protein